MAAGRDIIDLYSIPVYPHSSDDDVPQAGPSQSWQEAIPLAQVSQEGNEVITVNDSPMNLAPAQQEQMLEPNNPPLHPGEPRREREQGGQIVNGWHNLLSGNSRSGAGSSRRDPRYARAYNVVQHNSSHQVPSVIAPVPEPSQMQPRSSTSVDIRNIIAFKRLQCYRAFRNRPSAVGYVEQQLFSPSGSTRRQYNTNFGRNSIVSSVMGYPYETRRTLRRVPYAPQNSTEPQENRLPSPRDRDRDRDQGESEYIDVEDEDNIERQYQEDADNNQRLSPTLPAENQPLNNSDNDEVAEGDGDEQRTLSPSAEEAASGEAQNVEDDSGQESEEPPGRIAENVEVLDITNEPEADAAAAALMPNRVKRRRTSSESQSAESFDMKDFNEKLLRLLECPVCLEWMEPPMWQCRRGHLVCGRCRGRLQSCPVCRTPFSSVRNRAMESVAELLLYPCRHGCGRHAKLRRRAHHEASCASRRYRCPAPACAASAPLPLPLLSRHVKRYHAPMLRTGPRHNFSVRLNVQQHEDLLLMVEGCGLFHLKIDVEVRTWGLVLYVAYIGPKCFAKDYIYEVTVIGQHNGRKLSYSRATHSDLECGSLNVTRQDCFHLTLDQAVNFVRVRNKPCERDRSLNFTVAISKAGAASPNVAAAADAVASAVAAVVVGNSGANTPENNNDWY